MGVYADYLNNIKDGNTIDTERKKMLKKISELRGNRDILVIASNLSENKAPISIDYTDILPVYDQLQNLHGSAIDIILETPDSQIYRHVVPNPPLDISIPTSGVIAKSVMVDLACNFCKSSFKIQGNFEKDVPVPPGVLLLSVDSDTIKCPICDKEHNISQLKIQIESKTGRKIV